MNWIKIDSQDHIDILIERSHTKPQVIFKHSTRCSISSMAKNRLERSLVPETLDFHILDLIKFRQISNSIAGQFNVHHESPQVLLIVKGDCIYDESHSGIDMDEILEKF